MGQHIKEYEGCHVFLTPPYLPHAFRIDDTYYKMKSKLEEDIIVLYFRKDIFEMNVFQLPEMFSIRQLMDLSKRGFKIDGKTQSLISEKMHLIPELTAIKRVICLLEILYIISNSSELEPIVEESFVKQFIILNSDGRIQSVYNYIIENIKNSISLDKAELVANMSKTGFCRYFKTTTGKTFSSFVNEIRIDYARRLLIEGKSNVTQIAYECGFHQPSYFDCIFKVITHKTPLEFKAQFNNLENTK
ncbi:AraC family transcriptional regulator [bacterium]|nr:AraC family transcriptional regulator [bacterium]